MTIGIVSIIFQESSGIFWSRKNDYLSILGKDNPAYFEYREIKGFISPNELVSTGIYSLDMIAADEKSMMFKHNYIPSISIHELEQFTEKSTGFGHITLNKEYMESIGLDIPRITELHFYFNLSSILRIFARIRSKISTFLIHFIRNKL